MRDRDDHPMAPPRPVLAVCLIVSDHVDIELHPDRIGRRGPHIEIDRTTAAELHPAHDRL